MDIPKRNPASCTDASTHNALIFAKNFPFSYQRRPTHLAMPIAISAPQQAKMAHLGSLFGDNLEYHYPTQWKCLFVAPVGRPSILQ